MKLLAIDTATDACSAALYLDGAVMERFELAPREHTRLIMPMIDALMAEAGLAVTQLDAVAFGRGPGSFTGVRIATGVIQGIAFAADLPVMPVSTLAAMAQQCFTETANDWVFAAMDARMGEIYWGVYFKDEEGYAALWGDETVIPVANAVFPVVNGMGIGTGWLAYETALRERLQTAVGAYDASYLPRAAYVARLGAVGCVRHQTVAAELAQPVYLRDKVAKKEAELKKQ
ncbi:MAG: tRNA (adenosine(37)-N6)-threonylcarbamoyltransferase complex dimerization subunit type 1 TsaB [Gammaproteobacteria bacterium]